jgi:hypothetical protein
VIISVPLDIVASATGGTHTTSEVNDIWTFTSSGRWIPILAGLPTPIATPARFVDNGDGTVTDYETGLMWEKKSDDGSIHDKDNTYTWNSTYTNPDGTAFTEFLATLNAGTGFAGYTDWRLPSEAGQNSPFTGPRELENILAAPSPCTGFSDPCVPPVFNTGCMPGRTVTECSCTQSDFYWSATTNAAGNPRYAWGVNFFDGSVLFYDKPSLRYARAVRHGF